VIDGAALSLGFGERKPMRRAARKPEREAADTRSPQHDEWLLDEALAETFPACDPISPSMAQRGR
jgi:hypothetical protein